MHRAAIRSKAKARLAQVQGCRALRTEAREFVGAGCGDIHRKTR